MELDMRGEECPLPTVEAVRAMKQRRASGVRGPIVVITDDAVCAEEIRHQARMLGYAASSDATAPSVWRITLEPVAARPRSS